MPALSDGGNGRYSFMQAKSARARYSSIALLRKQSVAIGICAVILAVMLLLAFLLYLRIPSEGFDASTYAFALIGLIIILFIVLLIALIAAQEKINTIFSSLIAVLEYNSRYLYRFYRQQAAHTFPVASVILLGVSAAAVIIGATAGTTADMLYLRVPLFVSGAAVALTAAAVHPYVRAFLNYHFCRLLGKDRHIVLARGGVITSHRILSFGFNSTTFFKAELRRSGSFDCITLHYHKRRGYSTRTALIDIPLPPDADPALAQELLRIYNSSDLFMYDKPSYM